MLLMSTTQHSSLTCEQLWLGHSSLFWKENPQPKRLTQQFLEFFPPKNSTELNPDSIPGPDFLSAEDTKIGKTAFSEMK